MIELFTSITVPISKINRVSEVISDPLVEKKLLHAQDPVSGTRITLAPPPNMTPVSKRVATSSFHFRPVSERAISRFMAKHSVILTMNWLGSRRRVLYRSADFGLRKWEIAECGEVEIGGRGEKKGTRAHRGVGVTSLKRSVRMNEDYSEFKGRMWEKKKLRMRRWEFGG